MDVCTNCHEALVQRADGKGHKRYVFTSKLLKYASTVLQQTFSTPSKRFLCPVCYQLLGKVCNYENAKNQFVERSKISKKSPLKTASAKRPRTPKTTPRSCKRPRVFSSHKGSHAKNTFQPDKRRNLKRATNLLLRCQYRRGIALLFRSTKGVRNALVKEIKEEMFKAIISLVKDQDNPLYKTCDVQTMDNFCWNDVLETIHNKSPLLTAVLASLVCRKKNDLRDELQALQENEVKAGAILSMLLFNKNNKCNFFQSINSIQLWTSGCKSEVISRFNSLGICLSTVATRRAVDVVRQSFDADMKNTKAAIEFQLRPHEEGMDVDNVLPQRRARRALFQEENIDHHGDERRDVAADHPGFTMCWDNIGRKTVARHQSTERTNVMHLWALCYAAKNRVPTLQHTENDGVVKKAKDVPKAKFLPSKEDELQLRCDLKFVIAEIICKYFNFFSDHFQEACEEMDSFHHFFDKQMTEKSELINLGVVQENPSSVAGTIAVLDKLQSYVPTIDEKPLTTIVYGDALSCERHNDAHNARVNTGSPVTRLEGVEPSPQEFHKRMLLMQDTMNNFFSGKSAGERGTLFHIKNVFGHHSVKADVSQSFNHVSDMVKQTTDCLVVLLAKKVLDLRKPEDEPPEIDKNLICNRDYCLSYLDKVCEQIVSQVWHETTYKNSEGEAEDEYPYCYCKEELEGAQMVQCGNENCKDLWFHYECAGVTQDDIEALGNEDWFCSKECERRCAFKFCCGEDKGTAMVGCDGPKCEKQWFHLECIGLPESEIPSGKWFCKSCKKKKRKSKRGKKDDGDQDEEDYLQKYCLALVWCGLNDRVRHRAVRCGNGERMIMYWRLDMPTFFARNHNKYFLLGHRLLAGINGWLPERLVHDVMWNRTVNLTGKRHKNLEMDLVNEYLNREFITDLKQKTNLTEETVARHGALVGSVKKGLRNAYAEVAGDKAYGGHVGGEADITETVVTMVKMYDKDELFQYKCGRKVKGFENFNFKIVVDLNKMESRIVKLSKKLDRRRAILHQ